MTAITQALNSALLQFLWQGVLVAFVLWIALFLMRRRSAHARYAANCAALALMAILPAITAWTAYHRPTSTPDVSTAVTATAVAAAPAPAPPALSDRWIAAVQTWLLPVWSFGVLLFSVRLVWGCGQIARMRRRGAAPDEGLSTLLAALARRLGIARPVRILIACEGESPSVVGWIRPVVLMPSAALLGLTAEQLEAVLAHELAHIRRHDYLVNLFQILVETVLFYHPAVWWVSARIRHERELCCDDLAVRFCGNAVCYARALTKLERLRVTAPAMAMGSNSGPMLYRIQRLLGSAAQEYAPSKLPAVLAAALAIACFGINLHRAHAQETASAHTKVFRFDGIATDNPGVTVDLGGASILHRSRVEYPGQARERNVDGSVLVELTLDGSGIVSGARILSGPSELRSAVLHSVLDWHFAQSSANSVVQVQIQFDHSKAAAASEDRVRTGYARDTRNDLALVTRDGPVEVHLTTPPAPPSQQSGESKPSLDVVRTQTVHGEAWTAGQVTENQIAPAREEQLRATRATTSFLEEQLQAAEASAGESGTAEQNRQIGELREKLQMARSAQEMEQARTEPQIAGRTLANIAVTGLPEGVADQLRQRLGLQTGDVLTESAIQAATTAVRQFDEHLEVNFGITDNNQAELHIAAPGTGRIFRFRVDQK